MRRGIKSLREDADLKPGDREKPTSGKKQMSQAKLHLILAVLVALPTGCRSTQQAEAPVGPHFGILTYNVNWGGPRPDLAAETIGCARWNCFTATAHRTCPLWSRATSTPVKTAASSPGWRGRE